MLGHKEFLTSHWQYDCSSVSELTYIAPPPPSLCPPAPIAHRAATHHRRRWLRRWHVWVLQYARVDRRCRQLATAHNARRVLQRRLRSWRRTTTDRQCRRRIGIFADDHWRRGVLRRTWHNIRRGVETAAVQRNVALSGLVARQRRCFVRWKRAYARVARRRQKHRRVVDFAQRRTACGLVRMLQAWRGLAFAGRRARGIHRQQTLAALRQYFQSLLKDCFGAWRGFLTRREVLRVSVHRILRRTHHRRCAAAHRHLAAHAEASRRDGERREALLGRVEGMARSVRRAGHQRGLRSSVACWVKHVASRRTARGALASLARLVLSRRLRDGFQRWTRAVQAIISATAEQEATERMQGLHANAVAWQQRAREERDRAEVASQENAQSRAANAAQMALSSHLEGTLHSALEELTQARLAESNSKHLLVSQIQKAHSLEEEIVAAQRHAKKEHRVAEKAQSKCSALSKEMTDLRERAARTIQVRKDIV